MCGGCGWVQSGTSGHGFCERCLVVATATHCNPFHLRQDNLCPSTCNQTPQDPSANREDTSTLLNRQLACLADGLSDHAPAVRVAAVAGACSVLNAMWELLPGPVTVTLVKKLAGEPSMHCFSLCDPRKPHEGY